MAIATANPTTNPLLGEETVEFYRRAMRTFDEGGVPFLVGGAYAYARYTGIDRHTKDFDVFVRPGDFDRAITALARQGWETERTFSHWLGKAYQGEDFVDVIFSSGNGVARVDDAWFDHAVEDDVFGQRVLLVPAEEMIWSKSFIMERERFDGGDVSHLLHCCTEKLDWDRLLRRFDADGGWRVLLAHLVLFGYIYPGDASRIPSRVIETLADRLRREATETPEGAGENLCRGTILSRSQYLVDILRWGYEDARERPIGKMSPEEIARWTSAAEKDGDASQLEALENG